MSEKTKLMAKELVKKMTIQEMMSQMLYNSPAIERLGIEEYNWWNEALHGVARNGSATVFPQAIGLAATFDEELLQKIADVIATEGRAKYNASREYGDFDIYKGLTYWAPNVNIFRDPRWGRGHETYGEDPYLSGMLGTAFVKGLQGDDEENLKAAACAKHFAVHSGPEAKRHHFDAKVSKQDLYDTYLYAFKRLVKDAKVEAVMGAYNRVNGEPACGSKTLLKDILRDEFGFEGHVVSDCWAVRDFHENHMVTKSPVYSAAMAVNNGCDLNCGCTYLYLNEAYNKGLISKEAIEEAVERLVEVRIRLGLIGKENTKYDEVPYSEVESKEHLALSEEASRESLVLLKNDGILPLDRNKYKTIGVIGPNANSRAALVGNYEGVSSRYITPLEGIQDIAGDDLRVLYAKGCDLYKDKIHVLSRPEDGMAEAVAVAKNSDVVVMCLGLDATIEGEEGDAGNEFGSGDKHSLKLPGLQQKLLEKVTEVGKPVIVLLLAGSAMDLRYADEYANAVLGCFYPGAHGGKAIAEALFGKYSPSGKLPVTFYKSDGDLPDFDDYSMENRTYRYFKGEPLYPFGFGLGYSKLAITNASIDKEKGLVGEEFKVSVTVRNEGTFSQKTALQLYVTDLEAGFRVPLRQLRGVKKIELAKESEETFEFVISSRDFAVIDEEGKCLVEPGRFLISVGESQPDDRSFELLGRKPALFEVTLTGETMEVEY